jgi:hypothetical protein
MDITMRNICECQKEFMEDQVKEIEKHKWIMSEKAGHDLGSEACRDWIIKYAKQFREFWFSTH